MYDILEGYVKGQEKNRHLASAGRKKQIVIRCFSLYPWLLQPPANTHTRARSSSEGSSSPPFLFVHHLDYLLIAQSGENRRRTALREAAGMWKERTDLPDFASLRTEWDRT